jgi:hypothetical protein
VSFAGYGFWWIRAVGSVKKKCSHEGEHIMNRLQSVVLGMSGIICALGGSAVHAKVPARVDEVLKWNEVLLNAVRQDNTPPPLASRNMAIVHSAVYEAVNAIDGTHTEYRIRIVPPPFASPEAAAATAAHGVLVQLYPRQKLGFDSALHESLAAIRDGPAKTEGTLLGEFTAHWYVDWRSRDLSANTAEEPAETRPGIWRPTPPRLQKALLPQWGRIAPFSAAKLSQFRPEPPPRLASVEYVRCFNETKALGAIDSTARTADQTEIAHFWADGPNTCTPPGHWNEIATKVVRGCDNTIAENARLFALLNISMADAAICCWDCKFSHSFWRPVTAIRHAADTGNPDTEPDPNWTPLLETPPFPAYTSGHSSFSGTAAAVLAYYFGTDDVSFTATSDGLPGVERSFASFSEAAAEAGRSRIYGGIHWECDNADGLAMGRALGIYVCRKLLLPRT